MDKKQIKKELAKRGFDYSMLADALNKSPSLISKIVGRKAKSRPVANAIAKVLGMDIKEVFPDVEEYHTEARPANEAEREKRLSNLKSLLDD